MLPFLPALLLLIVQGSLGIDRCIASNQFTEALALLCDPRVQNTNCAANSDELDSDAAATETSYRIATATSLLIQWFETDTNITSSEPVSEPKLQIQVFAFYKPPLASVVASRLHPNRAGPC